MLQPGLEPETKRGLKLPRPCALRLNALAIHKGHDLPLHYSSIAGGSEFRQQLRQIAALHEPRQPRRDGSFYNCEHRLVRGPAILRRRNPSGKRQARQRSWRGGSNEEDPARLPPVEEAAFH